jgi:single-stranded DNA-specific DHH superfamily exonuclease
LAEKLDHLNRERREIEARVRDAALEQAEARGVEGPLAWAAGAGWHPGVVGIAAARMKEATNRPAVVIGIEDGIGKGSARSVPGIDLGAAIHPRRRHWPRSSTISIASGARSRRGCATRRSSRPRRAASRARSHGPRARAGIRAWSASPRRG